MKTIKRYQFKDILTLMILSIFILLTFSACKKDSEFNNDEWVRKADFPEGISESQRAFVFNGKGYVLESNFLYYDPTSDEWHFLQKLPFDDDHKAYGFVFTINDKVYVGAGSVVNYSKDVWEYNPSTDSWTQKNDFPGSERIEMSYFTIGDKGYIVGGIDEYLNIEDSTVYSLKDVWEYDPSSDIWTRKTDFPGLARNDGVGFSMNEKGYIGIGKHYYTEGGLSKTMTLNDFWEYDPISDKWVQKADFPGEAGSSAVGVSLDGKAYVGSGFLGINDYSSEFWEYDTSKNEWTQLSDFSPYGRYGCFAFSIDNTIYLGGGRIEEDQEWNRQNGDTYFWSYTPK